MNSQNQSAKLSNRRIHRKDFLYKVAKVKQNKILCEKKNQEQFQHEEELKKERIQTQFQQQFDFQFQTPQFEISKVQQTSEQTNIYIKQPPNIKIQQQFISFNQKTRIDNKQNKDPNIIPNKQQKHNKLTKQNEIEIHKQINTQNDKTTTKNQYLSYNKPFTFDSDQQQQQQQQQNQQVDPQNIQNTNKKAQQANNSQTEVQNQSGQQAFEQECSYSQYSQQQLKGVSLTSNCLQGNVIIKITNKNQLIFSKIPPGIILKCIIRRSSDIFNPQFDFYLHNGLKHMISAKKYSLAKRQIFKLSLELGKYKDHDIIGVVMANTVHNTYWIYKQVYQKQKPISQLKSLIKYQKIQKQKQRQMKINIFLDKKKQTLINQNNLIHQIYQQGDLILKNQQFKQKQNSTKNYHLFDEEDKQYQYLKFKKISDHMFQVQIQHPLSPFQAFGISLTRFDAELK